LISFKLLSASTIEQVDEAFVHPKLTHERGRVLVFYSIRALKPARKIHWEKPSRDKARMHQALCRSSKKLFLSTGLDWRQVCPATRQLLTYDLQTKIADGIPKFVEWFRSV
jgi:hypothetical protein